LFLSADSVQTRGDVVLLCLLVLISLECRFAKSFELSEEARRILK
jgi:hypothetical protein